MVGLNVLSELGRQLEGRLRLIISTDRVLNCVRSRYHTAARRLTTIAASGHSVLRLGHDEDVAHHLLVVLDHCDRLTVVHDGLDLLRGRLGLTSLLLITHADHRLINDHVVATSGLILQDLTTGLVVESTRTRRVRARVNE